MEANAAAYGSIRNFYGPVRMNHDGSQFIFAVTADDRGRAVFLCDTLTGNKQQIIEDKNGVGIWNDDFDVQAGPWSPDDSHFICVVSNWLMVCSTDTNQAQSVIEDKPFSEAVWLTSAEFAYVTDQTNLCLAQKHGDGKWEHKIFMSEDVPLSSLTAIGSDTVAWLENGALLCRIDFSEGPPETDDSAEATATNIIAPVASGLRLWLDASKLRQTNQSPVLGLADSSRNRNDAVWNENPPVFNGTDSPLALNGRGTIHFGPANSPTNAVGLKTITPFGIVGSASRSVFVVMRHDADQSMMVSMGDTRTNGTLFAVEGDRDRFYLPGGWYSDNMVLMTSTNWNLLEVAYDGVRQRGYVNGILRGVANVSLNTAEKEVEIGSRTATDGKNSKTAEGDFAELLVYDRALNDAERKQVENYLGEKWFGRKSITSHGSPVWYETGLGGLTGMAYSKETGVLLLDRTDNGQDSIWRLDTASGPDASPTQVMQGQSLSAAQWAGPDRFVYSSRLDTRFWLKLADLSGNEKKQLLQLWGNGSFDWFRMSPDQKQLLLFGNISNAPAAGLWRCNLASGTLRPVISVSDYPFIQGVTVLHEPMNLPGGNVTCTIYRPANFDPHKKYPLVIGDTMITDPIYGEPFMTGMAACGATVAVVERPWWTVGIEQWAENVQGLYEQLKSDPTVDTRRVYLFAASAETSYLSQLVETNPAPWRGFMLLNPSELPDFSKLSLFQPRPKILLDAGGEEHLDDRFIKYQKDALNSGVIVEFYTHPGETHRTVGIDAKLQRSRELMRFIFEE